MRILFCGEKPMRAAPSLTIARRLESAGCQAMFNRPADVALKQWIRRVLRADVLMYITYGPCHPWFMRRVGVAAMLGRPMIRWWVGSDVLNAIQDPAVAAAARRMDRFVFRNLTHVPRLAEELAGVGVRAQVIPPPAPPVPSATAPCWSPQLARSILVYLPAERADFYGARVVEELAERRPDVAFYLLRDDGKRFAGRANVVSMPWTDDMESVYAKIGCLLRITEHDGLSRMVVEALARGKHVIFSWPLEGCILAHNAAEAEQALRTIEAKGGPNLQGPHAVADICSSREVWVQRVLAVMCEARARRWSWALGRLPHLARLTASRAAGLSEDSRTDEEDRGDDGSADES